VLGLNDFVALTAWSLGMNGKVAAVLWGSIRLIIKVCVLFPCCRVTVAMMNPV
jgi:hypothetical protein